MERKGTVRRKTNETNISVELALDGSGVYSVNTGVGFFDHMLSLFSKHAMRTIRWRIVGSRLARR